MSYLIAITGKGGTGKTSIASLLIAQLTRRGCKPVLAVDADPNMCLDAALGVKAEKTVGGIREEAREIAGKGMAVGVSKQELLEMKISESLVEGDDFDLIAMGRPEGPGCYCYANSVLKSVISQVSSHYPYVVLDNEAGLENLSRRIVREVDLLVMVTDPSKRGYETVRRLYMLAQEMEIRYKRLAVVVNRIVDGHSNPEDFLSDIPDRKVFALGLPENREFAELGERGADIWSLPSNHILFQRVDGFLDHVLPKNEEV